MSIQVFSTPESKAADAALVQTVETKSEPVAKEAAEQKDASPATGTEETEAEESDAEEESEALEATDESKEEESEKPKKKSGAQRRKERAERAEAEVARLQRIVEEMALKNGAGESKVEPKAEAKAAASSDDEPNPDDFDNHADFVKAVARHELKLERKAQQAEQERSKLMSEQQKLMEAHMTRLNAFAEKNPGFPEAIQELRESGLTFSVTVDDILISSENGPAMLMELAQNHEELKRINALSPTRAALEMGKLEARIASRSSEAQKPETKKTTNAPKPITPVGSNGGKTEKSIYDVATNGSQKEYEAIRKKQIAARQSAW